MKTFELTSPIRAVRDEYGANESEVRELVQSDRSGVSSSNGLGDRTYRFYNSGPEIVVHDGEWIAVIAGATLVLSDEAFAEGFKERAEP